MRRIKAMDQDLVDLEKEINRTKAMESEAKQAMVDLEKEINRAKAMMESEAKQAMVHRILVTTFVSLVAVILPMLAGFREGVVVWIGSQIVGLMVALHAEDRSLSYSPSTVGIVSMLPALGMALLMAFSTPQEALFMLVMTIINGVVAFVGTMAPDNEQEEDES